MGWSKVGDSPYDPDGKEEKARHDAVMREKRAVAQAEARSAAEERKREVEREVARQLNKRK